MNQTLPGLPGLVAAAPGLTGPAKRLDALTHMTTARRVGNGRAEIFEVPDFITDKACKKLIKLADAAGYQSTVADPNGDAEFRTSRTTDM